MERWINQTLRKGLITIFHSLFEGILSIKNEISLLSDLYLIHPYFHLFLSSCQIHHNLPFKHIYMCVYVCVCARVCVWK